MSISEEQPLAKTFSVDAANHMLPLVRVIAADIVRQHGEVAQRQERLKQLKRKRGRDDRRPAAYYADEVAQFERELDREIAQYQAYTAELEQLGLSLADASVGLVEFPTRIEGKLAWLSWKAGEEEIGYWRAEKASPHKRISLLASVGGDSPAAAGD